MMSAQRPFPLEVNRHLRIFARREHASRIIHYVPAILFVPRGARNRPQNFVKTSRGVGLQGRCGLAPSRITARGDQDERKQFYAESYPERHTAPPSIKKEASSNVAL